MVVDLSYHWVLFLGPSLSNNYSGLSLCTYVVIYSGLPLVFRPTICTPHIKVLEPSLYNLYWTLSNVYYIISAKYFCQALLTVFQLSLISQTAGLGDQIP